MMHLKHTLCALLAAITLSACTSTNSGFMPFGKRATATNTMGAQEVAIRGALSAQVRAWNRGDIDGFLDGYWKNDDLRFASGDTVTRGWQAVADRYRARYGDAPETMGSLAFTGIEVVPLTSSLAMVHGRWALETNGTAAGDGLFTLAMMRLGGRWVITSDTTTSSD